VLLFVVVVVDVVGEKGPQKRAFSVHRKRRKGKRTRRS